VLTAMVPRRGGRPAAPRSPRQRACGYSRGRGCCWRWGSSDGSVRRREVLAISQPRRHSCHSVLSVGNGHCSSSRPALRSCRPCANGVMAISVPCGLSQDGVKFQEEEPSAQAGMQRMNANSLEQANGKVGIPGIEQSRSRPWMAWFQTASRPLRLRRGVGKGPDRHRRRPAPRPVRRSTEVAWTRSGPGHTQAVARGPEPTILATPTGSAP